MLFVYPPLVLRVETSFILSLYLVLHCFHSLPLYSTQVLHKVGVERAAAAVITLDTPGANYRVVWTMTRNFPHVKTFVRAHDVDHGVNLEKAGATAVSSHSSIRGCISAVSVLKPTTPYYVQH